jgi:UDP-N-acetylmuramate dehydrogenase
MVIYQNISLKPYNTFGLEAKAAQFVECSTVEEVQVLCITFNLSQREILVLGGGSNVLLTKDFEGMVVKMNLKGIERVNETEEHIFIKANSGENWHEFVLYCVEKGYGGVENLSLIPGCIGAAPMQNIGAYGVEVKDVIEEVQAVEISTGIKTSFSNAACKFGYRESIFKNEAKGKYIITSVTYKLSKKPQLNISYGAIKDVLQEKGIGTPSLKDVSDAVIAIRSSKLPDPKVLGNSGSFFKNPEIDAAIYEQLKASYPTIPGYPTASNQIKVPAGWLIEQCGWKGKRVGNTGAHKDQALVLVNYGNATGDEIFGLALEIQKSVKEKFGIHIIPEVNII